MHLQKNSKFKSSVKVQIVKHIISIQIVFALCTCIQYSRQNGAKYKITPQNIKKHHLNASITLQYATYEYDKFLNKSKSPTVQFLLCTIYWQYITERQQKYCTVH